MVLESDLDNIKFSILSLIVGTSFPIYFDFVSLVGSHGIEKLDRRGSALPIMVFKLLQLRPYELWKSS